MSSMLYVIVLVLCLATSFSSSTEYCVVITESVQEHQNCHNLSYYAENSQLLSNQHRVELQFVNIGQYELHTDLVIENVTYVSIVGKISTRVSLLFGTTFWLCSFVEVVNISLSGGRPQNILDIPTSYFKMVGNHIILYQVTLHFFEVEIDAITIIALDSSVSYCKNFSVCGNCRSEAAHANEVSVTVFNSTFDNALLTCDSVCLHRSNFSLYVENCTLQNYNICYHVMDGMVDFCTYEEDKLEIQPLIQVFVGTSLHMRIVLKEVITLGGINIEVMENDNNISVEIENSEMASSSDDKAIFSLHVYLLACNNVLTIDIINVSFVQDTENYPATCIKTDNVVSYPSTNINSCVTSFPFLITFFIMNTKIDTETGIDIRIYKFSWISFNLTVIGSTFSSFSQALYAERIDTSPQLDFDRYAKIFLYLHNSTFGNNDTDRSVQAVPQMQIINTEYFLLDNCYIQNCKNSAVAAYSSDVTLSGNTTFSNNRGERGAALSLYHSFMIINYDARVVFQDNHADDVGGAIFVYDARRSGLQGIWCFFQPGDFNVEEGAFPKVYFVRNTAKRGGNDIFGSKFLSGCKLWIHKTDYIDKVFVFDNSTSNIMSSVSSNPQRVCVCNKLGVPQCQNKDTVRRLLPRYYPGELFTVPVIVAGYDNGAVPGAVYANPCDKDEVEGSLRDDQYIQEVRDYTTCFLLSLAILTNYTHKSHDIMLNVHRIGCKWSDPYWAPPSDTVVISFFVEDCPPGFMLTTTPPYTCTCHYSLVEKGIETCVIIDHTGWVFRSETVWVSSAFGDDLNSLVVHPFCPYDYCLVDNVSVNALIPDIQCAFNRSGVLCGGCYGNNSLVLGSSRCLPCGNSHIPLFFVFVIAGVVLVVFIKLLDFTVTQGTLNGMIFYANVLWANKSIFFPSKEILHPVQHILQVFIAWLNLDVGIETCFFNGLNGYWKTWLQFLFPLYVWSIAGVMTITARYFTRAGKLLGNNSVPVLATLILLSYTKLLRTIITCIGFSVLEYPSGPRPVWLFDGNVPFFSAAHAILFLTGLAILLFLWLPYTFVLFSIQWLRRKSNLKPLRWINRWKPFFDAYLGQLKPKYHYWVGLLLLVRVFLLVLFAVTSAVIPRINILAILVVTTCLFIYLAIFGMMYKSFCTSLLECSFIANLLMLAAVMPYTIDSATANDVVVYTSISIVFFQFWCLVIFHTYKRIKSSLETNKRRNRSINSTSNISLVTQQASVQYREPLLEDT